MGKEPSTSDSLFE
jgi:vacuolar-type H+-ATPase subunit H